MSYANLPQYTLCAELKGTKGAVNALLFSQDGKLLLSGADDERIRVWDTADHKCVQTLYSEKWGQVTTLAWIHAEGEQSILLSVGSGRGCVTLCPMASDKRSFLLKEAVTLTPFNFNDAVETQAYDRLNSRLVITSHSGQIKMFSVENTNLKHLWTVNTGGVVTRAAFFFGGANQSLLTFGLESGEMCCREAQNSNVLWKKTLAGGIGNAALSSDETTLIVDNLSTALFDVYNLPANNPSRSLSLAPTRRFTKQCAFADGAKIAVCGSDSNRIHILDVTTSECLQTLTSGAVGDMTQTVAATNANGGQIACGSTSGRISLWEKELKVTADKKQPTNPTNPGPQVNANPNHALYHNALFGFLGGFMGTCRLVSASLAGE